MRTRHTRTAAATAALAAGVLAAMSLRPSAHATPTLAARNPAVEVRTQVIRRTVHVSGRAHHGSMPARRRAGSVGPVRRGASHGGATRTSGSHTAPGPAHPVGSVVTRPSPGHTSPGVPASSAHPVTTRPSPGHAGSPPSAAAPRPVATRTSPGRSSTGTGSSSAAPVSTHSSGSHHGDDGREGRGND